MNEEYRKRKFLYSGENVKSFMRCVFVFLRQTGKSIGNNDRSGSLIKFTYVIKWIVQTVVFFFNENVLKLYAITYTFNYTIGSSIKILYTMR